jgi:hypothetical protein
MPIPLAKEAKQMPQPWTSKLIIKALGVQKCNGSMDAATEDLPLEKAIEVIGTCVSMRVKIDGLWPKEALEVISRGDWDERF